MAGIKRVSWADSFHEPGGDKSYNKKHLFLLDDLLYDLWALGCNIIVAWTPLEKGIEILRAPHYQIGETITRARTGGAERVCQDEKPDKLAFFQKILAGPKQVSLETLHDAANLLGCDPIKIALPFTPGNGLSMDLISDLVKRYSLTFVDDRAVALFDVVGFSHYSPLEQATQLNSLSFC